jgi:hypothetical protein
MPKRAQVAPIRTFCPRPCMSARSWIVHRFSCAVATRLLPAVCCRCFDRSNGVENQELFSIVAAVRNPEPRRPPVSSSGTNTRPTRLSSGTRRRCNATAPRTTWTPGRPSCPQFRVRRAPCREGRACIGPASSSELRRSGPRNTAFASPSQGCSTRRRRRTHRGHPVAAGTEHARTGGPERAVVRRSRARSPRIWLQAGSPTRRRRARS